jgi:hypothetical protein
MTTYTITLTPEQDTALAILIQRTNAARDPTLPVVTVTDYIQARANEIATSYAEQIAAETQTLVFNAYKAAASTVQDQIKTTLGL